MYFKKQNEKGAAMLITMLMMVSLSLGIILSITVALTSELHLYESLSRSKKALVVADAAIDDAFYRVVYNKNLSASENFALNNASATVSIVSPSATERYFFSTGSSSEYIRKSYTQASKSTIGSFAYGAQVGEGGIVMSNNSTINGIGLSTGSVYSLGQIVGAPGVTITGDTTVSSGITEDQIASSTSCVSDEVVGKNNPTVDYAQSFIMATDTDSLAKVSLYIKRNGNPTGATVIISPDNGGKPSTTTLASQALSYSLVGTTYGWVDISFGTPPTLTSGSKYWILIDSTQTASKYWYWCRSNTDTYVSGSPQYKQDWSTSGTWTAVSGDMAFKLYFGGGVSKLDSVSVSGTVKADTITNSSVGKDAYYKTITSSSVAGASYPGSPTPPDIGLPISSSTIAQWKSEAEAGGVVNGNCGTGGVAGCNTASLTLGPKKINGNLLIDNNAVLILSGVVYVTGKVIISNNGTVKCASGYGTKSCMLIADGSVDLSNNAIFQGSGSIGSFVLVLTTIQNCNGTAATGCATGNSGIYISNNVNGALFYTTDSMVYLSNNAYITAVVAYKLKLDNNTAITYDPNVMNMLFSTAATSTALNWDVNRWSEFY